MVDGVERGYRAFDVDAGRITGNSEAKDIVLELLGEAAITREAVHLWVALLSGGIARNVCITGQTGEALCSKVILSSAI